MATVLRRMVEEGPPDLVIANGENASGGLGLTPGAADELFAAGVDVITSGNHLWKFREINDYLARQPRLLRPFNYPGDAPGRGAVLVTTRGGVQVGVINIQGQIFMEPLGCPFRGVDQALAELEGRPRVVLVDFHAEATSEKRAMGFYLDGRVSALFGTHTHVPTADEEVLPKGTGYITDLGMTGPYASVIGTQVEPVIRRFLTLRPVPFKAAHDDVRACGALFSIDPESGRCQSVTRVCERV